MALSGLQGFGAQGQHCAEMAVPSWGSSCCPKPISEPCVYKMPSPHPCWSLEQFCLWDLESPAGSITQIFWWEQWRREGLCPGVRACCAGCAHQLLMLHQQVVLWFGLSSFSSFLISSFLISSFLISLSLISLSLISCSLSLEVRWCWICQELMAESFVR